MQSPLRFEKVGRFPVPVSALFAWHERPGALERLIPPWDAVTPIFGSGGIQDGAEAMLKIQAGPFPIRWHARHFDYQKDQRFRDCQLKGPFAHWVHTHDFFPDGPSASRLSDQVEYQLPFYPFGDFLGGKAVRDRLRRVFAYRHATLRSDLIDQRKWGAGPPMTGLISGASGVVGSALTPYLSTAGHHLRRLVRRPPREPGEIFWDPARGTLDRKALAGVDAVIHLAGENIGEGIWTAEKKKRILQSRILSTRLLAEAAAALDPPPKVFVCASAIGFYGERGDCPLTEADCCGGDFVSQVCQEWEDAAQPVLDRGIRLVFLRIGVALTPKGGALKKLLPAFQMGLGGPLGSGAQYISWISIDDLIRAIHYAIAEPSLAGPINLVAPAPVSNQAFSRTLARVLNRPAPLKVPAWAVRLAFGQMGKEIPLSSTRVVPEKLLQAGFSFRHPHLEGALRHLLGRI